MTDYYMARYSTQLIMTFELIAGLAITVVVLSLYAAQIDSNSLWVYLLASGLHSGMEIFAQLAGVRKVTNAKVLGVPVGFPIPCLITGLFEGGLISLAAYHFVRAVVNQDRFSIGFFISLVVVFGILSMMGALRIRTQRNSDPTVLHFTRRKLFSAGSLWLLFILFALTGGYFALIGTIQTHERVTILYFLAGVALFLSVLIVPFHYLRVRFIERQEEDEVVPAGLAEQIVIMYPFNTMLETGWFVHHYMLFHFLGLIEFGKNVAG